MFRGHILLVILKSKNLWGNFKKKIQKKEPKND